MSKTSTPICKMMISTLHHPAALSYMEFWHEVGTTTLPDIVTVRYVVNDPDMARGILAVPQLGMNDTDVIGCDIRYIHDFPDTNFYVNDKSVLVSKEKARNLWNCLLFGGWGRPATAEWKQYP